MTQPDPAGAIVDGVDVDAVHTAVSDCPGVARVGGGSLAALTTYLPGRRIPGIRISPESVEIEVAVQWGATVADLSRDIHAAVAGLVSGRRVDVTIADIVLPGEDATQAPPVPPSELEEVTERPALPAAPTHPPVVPPER